MKTIPHGPYCYHWAPAVGSGFPNQAELDAHLETLPLEEQIIAHIKLTRMVRCPFWQKAGKGRVRCKLLKRTAVGIGQRSQHLARIFYKHHPKAQDRDKGFLLGDAVKECTLNR